MSTVYNFQWALDVVSKFTEKYWRATNYVAKVLGISYKNLVYSMAKAVQSSQHRFERQKHIIKEVNRYVLGTRMEHELLRDPAFARKYLTYEGYIFDDLVIDGEIDEKRFDKTLQLDLPL